MAQGKKRSIEQPFRQQKITEVSNDFSDQECYSVHSVTRDDSADVNDNSLLASLSLLSTANLKQWDR